MLRLRVFFGIFCAFLGFSAGLMMQVGPHDAATNVCNWLSFWQSCSASLPGSFDKWAWMLPASLLCAAAILLLWAPAAAVIEAWSKRYGLIPLHEAASHIYGELRGTDLGRFVEGDSGSADEILDNVGMQILHNADVQVRRHPSPNWETFPKSELKKMGVCQGATGIRYFGQDQSFYTDPRVSQRDVARVAKKLKESANFVSEWSLRPAILESPLQIIFDPTNPARRFWSRESPKDEHGNKNPGVFWEYRVDIKNSSSKTIRNVSVTVEHIGRMPVRPIDTIFDKIGRASCDLKPGCSELVPVIRWPIPLIQAGMLADSSALAYGPVKITAAGDDVRPSIRTFHFDYQREPMLFD
jgi:hypothetical protein